MRTMLKWLGRIVLGLVVLIAIVAAFIREQLVNQSFHAPDVSIMIPADAASIERGHHLATVISDCTGCHGTTSPAPWSLTTLLWGASSQPT